MNCPVCGKEMIPENLGNVHVDICRDGCQGMWFDWFELDKLDEKNEGFGLALQKALKYSRSNEGKREKINCPKCGIPMFQHKHKSAKEIDVDECYNCAGFFLDSGELVAIRDNYMSAEEQEKYAHDLVADMPSLEEAKKERAEINARMKGVDKFTKYLRLSYYTGE